MEKEELPQRYEELLPKYGQLRDEAKFILENALHKKGIKVHSLQSRVKALDSFLDKAERKHCKDPLEEIDDICGLRVVCLFLSDLDRIGETIRDSFAVVAEDNRVEGLDVSSFGYSAVHFVATMKDSYKGPRYDDLASLKVEIQVATIAMHAWASISHYLDYKTKVDVPSDLRRDFYALSGLFYVADTHFEMFFKARAKSLRRIESSLGRARALEDTEINLDSLGAYLRRRFPDRVHASPSDLSRLVWELTTAGHTSIASVEKTVEKGMNAIIAWENHKQQARASFRFADQGIVRYIYSVVEPNYPHQPSFRMPERFRKMIEL